MAGTKNRLTDLNDHLFAEMERLGDEDLKGESLMEELERAKAIKDVATVIVDNAALLLKAACAADNMYDANARIPRLLEGDV